MTRTPGIDLAAVRSRILDTLRVPPEQPWYAAYSGGVDSTVLLHLLSRVCGEAGTRLVALHADHGLHPDSSAWRRRCERQCHEWDVECRSTALSLDSPAGLGPEGRARQARYRWFAEVAGEDAWLFTGHHRGDQAETVIERLSRGSGPRGLRGIPPVSRIRGMNVVRALLDVTRADIEAYAVRQGLTWVTDDSNQDPAFTRNYIRGRVLPLLKDRWPEIEAALATTAATMLDSQAILDEEAAADLECLDARTLRGDPSLNIAGLAALAAERRRNALRHWIHRETGVVLGFRRLERIAREAAGYPAQSGGLRWPPVELRPHRGRLYLVRRRERPAAPLPWALADELELSGRLVLRARPVVGRGLSGAAVRDGVTVRFRRGGEKCRLPGRAHRHALKNILQDAGIPPWQRSRMPLITVGEEIAAVADLVYCDPFTAGPGEAGIEIEVTYT